MKDNIIIKKELKIIGIWPFRRKRYFYDILFNGKDMGFKLLTFEDAENERIKIKERIEAEASDYKIFENGLGQLFIERKETSGRCDFSYKRLPIELNSVDDAEAWIRNEEKRNTYKEVKRIWKDDLK